MISTKAVVFDLDDTLLDTSKWLLDDAIKDTCSFLSTLVSSNASCDQLIEQRTNYLNQNPRGDWILNLIKNNTPFHKWENLYQKSRLQFYERQVPSHIKLEDCVFDTLKQLCQQMTLFLVTQGSIKTQNEKINLLNIMHFFKEIIITPSVKAQDKAEAYLEIEKMNLNEFSPSDYLCVGNRVDTDLAPAKKRGWNTCWIKRGEHLTISPSDTFEKPDYVLSHVCDIFKVWQEPTQVSFSFQMQNHK